MSDAQLPSRLLLATDMSARCDRALARAALLTRAWHSDLVVVHAVHPSEVARRDQLSKTVPSWRRPESWVATVERQLRSDLDAMGITAPAKVVLGTPAEAVLASAGAEHASLIVLGIAKDARMGRIKLGSTVDSLVRHAQVPVLNVRSRARAPYRHVVVASDFSAPSRRALELAAQWFGDVRLTVFHAFTPPGATGTGATVAGDDWRSAITEQCDAQLAEAGLAARSLPRLIEQGRPEALLNDYVTSTDVDLVVLGSHGRSGLLRAMLGSTAESLLHALDCDTLVVRGA